MSRLSSLLYVPVTAVSHRSTTERGDTSLILKLVFAMVGCWGGCSSRSGSVFVDGFSVVCGRRGMVLFDWAGSKNLNSFCRIHVNINNVNVRQFFVTFRTFRRIHWDETKNNGPFLAAHLHPSRLDAPGAGCVT